MAEILGWGLVETTFDAASGQMDPVAEAIGALGLRGLRPASRATRIACLAAAEAIQHPSAPPAEADRRAIVLGTRFASIEPLIEFNRSGAVDGPMLVNPASFPNVVVNAHAAYVAMTFQFSGPNITLCGDRAGADAIALGLDLLALGRADVVLAGGVEATGPNVDEGIRRAGGVAPAEAAAFVLLGRDESPRRAEPGDAVTDALAHAAQDSDGAAAGARSVILALRSGALSGAR
jgi:3-oxoacyl-(acyl-carrier-protein) synthase